MLGKSHTVILNRTLCSISNLAECYKTDKEYSFIPLILFINIYFQRDCTISKYLGTIQFKGIPCYT